jgi:hypothetical protein
MSRQYDQAANLLGDRVGGVFLHELLASHQVVDGILMNDHFKGGISMAHWPFIARRTVSNPSSNRNPFVARFPFVN